MSHFNLIKHNRVFLEPGNSNPSYQLLLSSDYSSITSLQYTYSSNRY